MASACICDCCGKTTREDEMLNWIEIRRMGHDATPLGRVPLDGMMFCGEACLLKVLSERRSVRA